MNVGLNERMNKYDIRCTVIDRPEEFDVKTVEAVVRWNTFRGLSSAFIDINAVSVYFVSVLTFLLVTTNGESKRESKMRERE